ncbi:hypothetical protein [uncultured Sphingomonas sp.]|nr:hypothetical protein [uncultured Sphingomonas sp.]
MSSAIEIILAVPPIVLVRKILILPKVEHSRGLRKIPPPRFDPFDSGVE